MFRWLAGIIDDGRRRMDFWRYEAEAREAHEAAAAKSFPTDVIRAEIDALLVAPLAEAKQRFGNEVAARRSDAAAIASVSHEAEQMLGVLDRQYTAELEPLYAKKKELFDDLATVKAKLNTAHTDLADAQSRISSWHYKSRSGIPFYGNAGRKLPERSIFGQDHHDLDRYKSDRDSAGADIGRYGDKRDSIKSELTNVNAQIADIKADQATMHRLKSEGHTSTKLRGTMKAAAMQLEHCRREIGRLELAHDTFLGTEKAHLGIWEREAEIKRRDVKRATFIASFDLSTELDRRRELHRQYWMRIRSR